MKTSAPLRAAAMPRDSSSRLARGASSPAASPHPAASLVPAVSSDTAGLSDTATSSGAASSWDIGVAAESSGGSDVVASAAAAVPSEREFAEPMERFRPEVETRIDLAEFEG